MVVARVDEAIALRDHWNDAFSVDVRARNSTSLSTTISKTTTTRTIVADARYWSLWPERPPLLLLGYAPPTQVDELIEREVTLTVWSEQQLRDIVDGARRVRRRASVQIKCNTGMNRIGVDSPQALASLVQLANSHADVVALRGVYTHFACAGESCYVFVMNKDV